MKKKYIVKVENDYLYNVSIVNLNGKQTDTFAYKTSDKSIAMGFRRKYIAQAFAKFYKGEVIE